MWKVTPNARFGIFGSIAGYYGNGSISTKIGKSGYVFLGGFQIEYKNLFFQIQLFTLIKTPQIFCKILIRVKAKLKTIQ